MGFFGRSASFAYTGEQKDKRGIAPRIYPCAGISPRAENGHFAQGAGLALDLLSIMSAQRRKKRASNNVLDRSGECTNPINWERKLTSTQTGEITQQTVFLPCGRKHCPGCGPKLYERQCAHFVDELSQYTESLRSFVLTVDPKSFPEKDLEVNSDTDQKVQESILKRIWAKYRKRINGRTKRKEGEFFYVYAVEYTEDGIPHLHVILSAPLETETLRTLWFECGGGVYCDAREIEDEKHLANAVKYILKDAFYKEDNEWTGHRRAIGASEGLGYHSKKAKEKRRRAAERQESNRPETVSSYEEYREWHKSALNPGGRQVVEMADGRSGILLDLTGERARVRVAGKTVACKPLNITPVDADPPFIASWSCSRDGGMKRIGVDADQIDLSSLDLDSRSRTFRYVDEDGRTVREKYDPETGNRTKTVLSPTPTSAPL